MKYIEFSNVHSLGYQIIYGIINLFLRFNIQDINQFTKSNHFFLLFLLSISQIICGLGLIIEKVFLSGGHNKNLYQKNTNEKKYVVIQKNHSIKNILFICLLLLFCSFFGNGGFYCSLKEKDKYPFWLYGIQLICSLFLCKLLLEYKYSRHKVVSIIIILISSLSSHICLVSINEYEHKSMLFQFIGGILYSLQEVLEKYMMHIKYQSPFKLLFIEGIFGTIITGINFIVYIQKAPNSLDWSSIKVPQIICFICIGSLYHSIRIIINMKYSPTHRLLGDSLMGFVSIFSYIVLVFFQSGVAFIFLLIFHIIECFFLLVYNECITLHFCRLDIDTKKKILERANIEEHEFEVDLSIKSLINDESEDEEKDE